MSRACRLYLGLVAFSLAGSLLSRLTGLDPGPIAPVASFLTLAVGVWAVFEGLPKGGAAAVLVLGAAAEISGLYTGIPFGKYAYTDRWAPTVPLPGDFRFPLLLPFAWLLVAGAATLAVLHYRRDLWAIPLAGLLAAAIDIPMEPVMAGPLDYWRWLEPGPMPGGAPVMNTVGWFAVSTLAAGILWSSGVRENPRREPMIVLGGHLALVFGLALIHL